MKKFTASDWDSFEEYIKQRLPKWYPYYGEEVFDRLRALYLRNKPYKKSSWNYEFTDIWGPIFEWKFSDLPLHVNDFKNNLVNQAVLEYRIMRGF